MKLRISRSQKSGGMVNKHVTFCIDARAELTPEEAADVKKYGLGKQVIYNSQRSKEHLSKSEANAERGGLAFVKAFANIAMAKFSLNITIDSLVKGQHIEATDMNEMVGTENALHEACETMRTFLETAATFDGKEEVFDF
jgi:hypothetical protein